jgi:hypothetical protein
VDWIYEVAKRIAEKGHLNRIARMSPAERAGVFAETAARKGLPEAIVEKDFWVCWLLMQLFSIDALSGRLLVKRGTSLSKIFQAINRFSEDIELAVDYAALGFHGRAIAACQDLKITSQCHPRRNDGVLPAIHRWRVP